MIQDPTPLAFIQNFIRKHRFILVALPVLLAGVMVVAMAIRPARYEAHGLIEVMARGSDMVPLGNGSAILPNDSMVLSQVEIITSSAVLKQTAEALHQPLPAIQRAVKAAPVGRSYIMRITANASDAETAQQIANTAMKHYQMYKVTLRNKRLETTAHWLRQHLHDLSETMHQSAEAAARYQGHAKLVAARDIPVTSQQLGELSTRLINARAEQAAVLATDSVSSQDGNSRSISEQLKSPVLLGLASEEAALTIKLAELRQKYGAKHPTLQAAQAEMAGLRAKQQQEIKRMQSAIHENLNIANTKVVNLEKQFQDLSDQDNNASQATIQLQTLRDEANADRVLYDSLLKYSKEVNLYADLEPSDSQIIAWAEKPLHSTRPPLTVILLLSAFAGLFLALLTALLQEQLMAPFQESHNAQ